MGAALLARGYFCATSGQVPDEMIQAYLEHHLEPPKDDNFKTES
jgi:putative transposase